jgi:hypothetical protein
LEIKDAIAYASRSERFAGLSFGLLYHTENVGVYIVRHTLECDRGEVVGAWCEVQLKGWKEPYLRTAEGTVAEGCIEEAVYMALDDLGLFDEEAAGWTAVDTHATESAPQEASQAPTEASYGEPASDMQKEHIKLMLNEVAKARGVSYDTAKSALMKSGAAQAAGVADPRDLKTSEQAETLIKLLEHWMSMVVSKDGE